MSVPDKVMKLKDGKILYDDLRERVGNLNGALKNKQNAPATAGSAGQVLGLDSNLVPVWVNQSGGGGGEMTDEEKLLQSELPGTSQTVVFSNNKPASITHTANNVAVRTDTFVWGTGTVTETRTLANGKHITITTDLTTMASTISAVTEVA